MPLGAGPARRTGNRWCRLAAGLACIIAHAAAVILPAPGCGNGGAGDGTDEPLYHNLLVLGWPANPDGSPSTEQRRRVDLALRLYEAGLARRAIFSGGAVENEWVEGEVMAAYAVSEGMDPADALVEGEARHTDENIRNSTAMMAEHGWWRAAIVSTPGHLQFVALCDANCVVRLGRAEPLALTPDEGGAVHVLDYVLYPEAAPVEPAECLDLVLHLQCIGAFQPPGV